MASKQKLTLAELVGKCLEGDAEAWSRLVDVITPVILSVCRSMGLTREDSLDIFGQTCYLLLTNLERLTSPDKVIAYVATTTRREVLASVRRGRLFEAARESGVIDVIGHSTANPEQLAEQAEETEILMKAIWKLPERDARLMYHLFLDPSEPSYEEISERLKIPVASIGPTRARCLLKLSRILKRMGDLF
ncbi:MAG TPA: sigma-70 family RNA polymerase sigma factor [candidate division Zixibacteria bacterium]|nr:sigma-70 family RNA polymerase sigma factor [candidate division Zixibacteria bacterium]